jgi:hypothetical protein
VTDKDVIFDMISRASKDGIKSVVPLDVSEEDSDSRICYEGKFKSNNKAFRLEKDECSITVYDGYSNFSTYFEFDKNGSLIFIGTRASGGAHQFMMRR